MTERQKHTPDDRLVMRYLDRVERGDEVTIARIQQTLEIDSETRPTEEDIRNFVKKQRETRHGRRKN